MSRSVLNETIANLNAYAAPRLASPSELLLTVDEIMGIIDQGELSRTLLLSAAHLKRIEVCARASDNGCRVFFYVIVTMVVLAV